MKQIFKNSILLLLALSISFSALALDEQVKMLIENETRANAAALRSSDMVEMEHYEIPASLVTKDFAKTVDLAIVRSLTFKKDGESYVRWVINPEDTKWHKEVAAFLLKNGISAEPKKYFHAYKTASRSYIVEDPVTHVQFSIKSSTNRTGGNWKDKKQEYADAFDIRMISDYVNEREKALGFEHIKVMYEPLIMGIEGIDQSLVVRELAGLGRGPNFYVPGFSVLHENLGRKIALANGSTDPLTFWTEHYIKAMAKATAEFSAKTGIWLDSPHSQNFLVELDRNMKPTGKIVIRDLGDIYIVKPMVEAIGRGDIAEKFSEQKSVIKSMMIYFGPLHGNKAPSWVSEQAYEGWGNVFAKEFMKEFLKVTQIPEGGLRPSWSTSAFSYIGADFRINGNQHFEAYLKRLASPVVSCSAVFSIAN